MADKRKIGATLAIDGEAEYKKAISEASKQLAVLASEGRKLSAEYADQEGTLKQLRAQTELYSKQTDEQRQKLMATLSAYDASKEALARVTAEYEKSKETLGEDAEETQKLAKQVETLTSKTADWQIKVNNAEAALKKAEKAENDSRDALDEQEKITTKVKNAYESLKEKVEEAKEKHEKLISVLEKAKDASKALASGGLKLLEDAAKASAAAVAAASAAAVALGKEVIGAFGELEQNLGGSEAVFGDYASEIQGIAEESYRTLGTTQSDYLATANKIGALLQGSGVETQRSMELTTQMMTRAADMASVMGIDTTAALEAVTGAAKGNYTMMDNLGVKMNNTTLEAYAVSKGFKAAWKDMSDAEKAEVAMQYFFEQTSQYAGNFEREATETISGSIQLIETSYQSLIAGLGNKNADIVNLSQNLFMAISAAVQNVIPVIENMAETMPDAIETLINNVMASGILDRIVEAGMTVVSTLLSSLLSEGNVTKIIDAAVKILSMLVDTITGNVDKVIDAAFILIRSLVTELLTPENLTKVIDAAFVIIEELANGIIDNLQLVLDAAFALIYTLATELVTPENLELIINTAVDLVSTLLGGLVSNLPLIIKGVGELIKNIVDTLIHYDWSSIGSQIWQSIKSAWSGKKVEVDASGVAHAGGLDYVPYDGYTAVLHKGEEIKSAGESLSDDRTVAELSQKVDALTAAIATMPAPQVNFYGTAGQIVRQLKKETAREDRRASAF